MFEAGPLPLGSGLVLLALFSSCASRGNVEMLEAQLRTQESRLRSYEQDISRLQADLTTSQRELDLVRSSLSGQTTPVAYEEETSSLARVDELVFNSLLTAARDHDGISGDERFHAVFYPSDAQGASVNLSGQIELEAIDPARNAGDRSIGHWNYSASEARKLWHSGFLSSGFQIEETWSRPPTGSKVVLIAKLTTLDGRRFEATHTLAVRSSEAVVSVPGKPPAHPRKRPDSFDTSAETRKVPDLDAWELEQPVPQATGPRQGGASRVGTEQAPPVMTEPLFDASPRPAPATRGLPTSDRWTEAEIPVLR